MEVYDGFDCEFHYNADVFRLTAIKEIKEDIEADKFKREILYKKLKKANLAMEILDTIYKHYLIEI